MRGGARLEGGGATWRNKNITPLTVQPLVYVMYIIGTNRHGLHGRVVQDQGEPDQDTHLRLDISTARVHTGTIYVHSLCTLLYMDARE